MKLDKTLLAETRRRIESAVVPTMERIYLCGPGPYSDEFCHGLKLIEKIVSYYDYLATGISVLGVHAAKKDPRVAAVIEKVKQNIDYYRRHIFNHNVEGFGQWCVPLRRLLLHIALFYERAASAMPEPERAWWRALVEEQVPLALAHCANFLPGEKNLHCTFVNNHTAIFMQGIYYCGKVFGRPDWVATAFEFAQRYYDSGHPDGYFEENTNMAREGGPSLVYTRLTAGCLYDVLDGKNLGQPKFVKAGELFRSFLNYNFEHIPIADERTNYAGSAANYGLALHSLTPPGRYYIVAMLEGVDFARLGPESLAVIHHELDLMREGECELPENRREGAFRISLPLGVLRMNGFTAGLSALRALNKEIAMRSDYALDQQNLAYLAHEKRGVILTGVKSKNDPGYSTFRVGDDAWPVKTGELAMGRDWAEARVFYRTFTGRIRWEIADTARLTLEAHTDAAVTTSLPITDERCLKTDCRYELKILKGFSPYTAGNKAEPAKAAVFQWRKKLDLEFYCPSAD